MLRAHAKTRSKCFGFSDIAVRISVRPESDRLLYVLYCTVRGAAVLLTQKPPHVLHVAVHCAI